MTDDPQALNREMLEPFEDPNHEGNSAKHHTGKSCIEPGCNAPAGTLWGKYWCFKHNVERIKHIGSQLENIRIKLEKR